MHQHPNNASTPEQFQLRKYPNIKSAPEHCINIQTLHKHPNIAQTPKYCINTQTLHKLPNISSTPKH